MKNKILVFFLLFYLLLNFIQIKTYAYGFGISKNSNHTQPDAGIYKEIIEKNNGYYVGSSANNKIYLTFDCGYENGNTAKILDVLKEQKITATFFITGHYIDSASELVLRMKEEGHVVANHSDKHKNITTLNAQEIKKEIDDLNTKYYKLTGENLAKFYRPPAGNFDDKSLGVVASLGYVPLFWSVAYPDWNHKHNINYVIDEICGNLHPGAIILMHAVSNDNALALNEIANISKKNGYIFSSIYEICDENSLFS